MGHKITITDDAIADLYVRAWVIAADAGDGMVGIARLFLTSGEADVYLSPGYTCPLPGGEPYVDIAVTESQATRNWEDIYENVEDAARDDWDWDAANANIIATIRADIEKQLGEDA